MQHVHFDLDAMERDMRRMFSELPTTLPDGSPLSTVNMWQDKTCDLMVAFMRWQLEMEMAGVDEETHARTVGVVLANLAGNVWDTFEQPQAKITAAHVILQAYVDQTNQMLHMLQHGHPFDASIPVSPVVSGRA